ncbi:MAG: nucleoside triphosphate pyrophosphohydrolase [Corallococcus sp.]|nr:nucleoside triphosphate pyrophosphohydrolase [Corallococcus sp.]
MITVVGMGRKYGDLTLDALDAIKRADVVVAKSRDTHIGATLEQLGVAFQCCDDLYQTSEDFDGLDCAIVNRLSALAKDKSVAFCVYGSGSDDSTTQALVGSGIGFDVVSGVSVAESVLAKAYDDGVKIYGAYAYANAVYTTSDSVVVCGIDDAYLAGEVKLKLLQNFDADASALYFDGKKVCTITVEQLDRQKFSYDACVYIRRAPLGGRSVYDYADAVELLRVLRGRNGCPWDREQTHETLKRNAVEESYELANAIESGDINNMVEETGDVLLQVLFHNGIGVDEGEWETNDVYSALCNKLILRHPHVFGDKTATDGKTALANWDAVKQKEHKIADLTANLYDIPKSFTALMRSQKAQSRAAKGGYDFADIKSASAKVAEEVAELLSATGDSEIEKEAGDLLFAAVNVVRLLGADAETALNGSCNKFVARVVECERHLKNDGKTLKDLTSDQFDALWEKVKANEAQ